MIFTSSVTIAVSAMSFRIMAKINVTIAQVAGGLAIFYQLRHQFHLKIATLFPVTIVSILSKNVVPVRVAFVPILILHISRVTNGSPPVQQCDGIRPHHYLQGDPLWL
jgi:predicted histidine transporter YuiF (NhaC family)